MFRSGFGKKGVCSKSVTKTLYRNKVLVSEWIFKLVCYCESCRLSEMVTCNSLRDITETSLNRLSMLLILKSSHRSCSVQKRALKNFTGKHLCWSLFLIKLQVAGLSATQMFPNAGGKPLKFAKFLRTLIFKKTCIFM